MAWQYTRGAWVLALLALVLVLVACGSEAASIPTAIAPSQAPSTALATEEPAVTAAPSVFAALPQSRTAEGYYVLGKPDAPGTIEFYSDFL